MRQVPLYLLIGNGRVARHFQRYFSLLQLPFTCWNRQEPLALLHQRMTEASHILLLISDQAIPAFVEQHLQRTAALRLHFSGSLVSQQVYGAHPLMTFNESFYDLSRYQSIPFIVDHDAPAFADLLPGLPNPHASLPTSLKAKYHAYCVLSGNFSCLLWQKLLSALPDEFHLPPSFAHPYLQQLTENILSNPTSALSGPLVRGDHQTLEKNSLALTDDPFQSVYQSFVACYQQMKLNEEIKNERH